MRVLCLNSLMCAAMLGLAVVLEGDSFAIPDAQAWTSLLALGLFGQVVGWVLIARAMPQLPPSLVGLLLLLQPALSFILDVILFARPTTRQDWIGLLLSLVGIFVGSTRPRPPPAAEPA
jgi:drug/metabolite transporter (DMT)-like permease